MKFLRTLNKMSKIGVSKRSYRKSGYRKRGKKINIG